MLKRVFGVEVIRQQISPFKIEPNLASCVSKDIESLLVTASTIAELQKITDTGDLIALDRYSSSVSLCIAGTRKLYSDYSSARTLFSNLNLQSSGECSNSYVANWVRHKIRLDKTQSLWLKSPVTAVVGSGDNVSYVDLTDKIETRYLKGLEAVFNAIEHTKNSRNALLIAIENTIPKISKELSERTKNYGQILNYDVVSEAEADLKSRDISIDLTNIMPYPSAIDFADLHSNPKKYASECANVTIQNNGEKVILTVEGDGVYQGFNLENLHATDEEKNSLKTQLKSRYVDSILHKEDDIVQAIESLDLNFEDINNKVFAVRYKVVATKHSVAVCPIVDNDDPAKAVALEILKRIKHSDHDAYTQLNEQCRYLCEYNQNVIDPRVALAIAGKINPALQTVFSDYPLSAHNKSIIESRIAATENAATKNKTSCASMSAA